MKPQKLNTQQTLKLIETLKHRFESNTDRHKGIKWADVEERLKTNYKKLPALNQMEATGGEPDVIGKDKHTGEIIFVDCSPESPNGRRSVCYDAEALASRKEHKPKHSALGMAAEMGIQILTEEEYRKLQKLGQFDLKTSSWIATPDDIRGLGGAMFCDRRYNTVWIYHNGAESYYAARGFRGSLRI
ncbi:MAG TPA: DUF4256 domain-containing protein [Pyrinomonadaceae bacterium]|nr:DUF4256 domain-containing protein [Pyrinomonadaceae bacterium]HMP65838.1 DUF4256 domain-containing protein [Pyrinomonadaceae bacterium]